MTLMNTILKKVNVGRGKKRSSLKTVKQRSPPPEVEVIEDLELETRARRRRKFKYGHVRPRVDASPPAYNWRLLFKALPEYRQRLQRLHHDNIALVAALKKAHYTGCVDSRWRTAPRPDRVAYHNRAAFLQRVQAENKLIYNRLITQGPKVASTASLRRDWAHNRREILSRAQAQFVLFPPVPQEDIEDPAFRRPSGVCRPRVYFTVRLAGGAAVGELCAELFVDVCPRTCELFAELLAGDGLGHSYVGTHFYRKVPHMFWSGGDVTYDNGFGCYKQRGRRAPIGAENYHFSHSMPGLLSMAVTCDDEMCGMFHITFKPLPQFDLRNVVFGRIIRPSPTFDSIKRIGSPLSSRPAVLLDASRQRAGGGCGGWLRGTDNTRIAQYTERRRPQDKVRTAHCLFK